LLESVRAMTHPKGDSCARCKPIQTFGSPQEQYLLKLLAVADRNPMASLGMAMLDPLAIQSFLAD